MQYVISDIHGCYEEFKELLEKIGFTEEDTLYVLGDMVDKGPAPIPLLMDLMTRPNVIPMLGNHDYAARRVLKKLGTEITEENVRNYLTGEDLLDYAFWARDGGRVTADQFRRLSPEDREAVLDYLDECEIFEDIRAGEKRYILVHAGIHGFEEGKPLEEYHFSDLILYRSDYARRYYRDPDTILVTGHTPTMVIRPDKEAFVYEGNGQIGLDCGCVYGGRLAALCLETGAVTYVESRQKKA